MKLESMALLFSCTVKERSHWAPFRMESIRNDGLIL